MRIIYSIACIPSSNHMTCVCQGHELGELLKSRCPTINHKEGRLDIDEEVVKRIYGSPEDYDTEGVVIEEEDEEIATEETLPLINKLFDSVEKFGNDLREELGIPDLKIDRSDYLCEDGIWAGDWLQDNQGANPYERSISFTFLEDNGDHNSEIMRLVIRFC